MYFIDVIRANKEIGTLNQSVKELTEDRDKQVTALKEYEAKNADYIASAQTYASLKAEHETAFTNLKAEYEAKLADSLKAIEITKAEATKEVEATKDSVAEETIKILASQGTSMPLDVLPLEELTKEQALNTLNKLTGVAATLFYQKHKALFN
jgi:hypothetical protein